MAERYDSLLTDSANAKSPEELKELRDGIKRLSDNKEISAQQWVDLIVCLVSNSGAGALKIATDIVEDDIIGWEHVPNSGLALVLRQLKDKPKIADLTSEELEEVQVELKRFCSAIKDATDGKKTARNAYFAANSLVIKALEKRTPWFICSACVFYGICHWEAEPSSRKHKILSSIYYFVEEHPEERWWRDNYPVLRDVYPEILIRVLEFIQFNPDENDQQESIYLLYVLIKDLELMNGDEISLFGHILLAIGDWIKTADNFEKLNFVVQYFALAQTLLFKPEAECNLIETKLKAQGYYFVPKMVARAPELILDHLSYYCYTAVESEDFSLMEPIVEAYKTDNNEDSDKVREIINTCKDKLIEELPSYKQPKHRDILLVFKRLVRHSPEMLINNIDNIEESLKVPASSATAAKVLGHLSNYDPEAFRSRGCNYSALIGQVPREEESSIYLCIVLQNIGIISESECDNALNSLEEIARMSDLSDEKYNYEMIETMIILCKFLESVRKKRSLVEEIYRKTEQRNRAGDLLEIIGGKRFADDVIQEAPVTRSSPKESIDDVNPQTIVEPEPIVEEPVEVRHINYRKSDRDHAHQRRRESLRQIEEPIDDKVYLRNRRAKTVEYDSEHSDVEEPNDYVVHDRPVSQTWRDVADDSTIRRQPSNLVLRQRKSNIPTKSAKKSEREIPPLINQRRQPSNSTSGIPKLKEGSYRSQSNGSDRKKPKEINYQNQNQLPKLASSYRQRRQF